MQRCPFCQGENEAGAFWCQHCKRDLAAELELPSTVVLKAVPRVVPASDPGPSRPTVAGDELPAIVKPSDLTVHDNPTLTADGGPASGFGLLAPEVEPKLVVVRGVKVGVPFPVRPGKNYIGRRDERLVDIDLEDQEAPDRVWASRQHAVISFDGGVLSIEDLNSLNGTFVNRQRVHPGQPRALHVGDVVQVGTVQLKVTL
jgi:hypothetical protein